ncbi:hypothetical protein [Actinomadura monticuli]|uniref:Uncharacterized protein n=1 Tax=Actinomadura monticuli TaxID=3097367 RepID=A0ABV4QIG6_9ACTN
MWVQVSGWEIVSTRPIAAVSAPPAARSGAIAGSPISAASRFSSSRCPAGASGPSAGSRTMTG